MELKAGTSKKYSDNARKEQYHTSAGYARYVHGSKKENIKSEKYGGLFNKQYDQQQSFPKLIQCIIS